MKKYFLLFSVISGIASYLILNNLPNVEKEPGTLVVHMVAYLVGIVLGAVCLGTGVAFFKLLFADDQ